MEVVCHENGSNCLLISKYQLQTLISLINSLVRIKKEESEFDVQIYTSDNNVDIAPHLYSVKIIQLKVDQVLYTANVDCL